MFAEFLTLRELQVKGHFLFHGPLIFPAFLNCPMSAYKPLFCTVTGLEISTERVSPAIDLWLKTGKGRSSAVKLWFLETSQLGARKHLHVVTWTAAFALLASNHNS